MSEERVGILNLTGWHVGRDPLNAKSPSISKVTLYRYSFLIVYQRRKSLSAKTQEYIGEITPDIKFSPPKS